MTNPYSHITIHQGLQGFRELENAWTDLAKNSGTHFVHYPAWYGAELLHKSGDRVYFVSLQDSRGFLCAVLPFQWTTIPLGYIKIPIVQLYYPNEMGINDILANMSLINYREDIVKALRKTAPIFLFVRWQCVPENGYAIPMDADTSFRHTHKSKYLHFNGDFDDFITRYSTKFRKDLLKKKRKIEETGVLKLKIVHSGNDLDEAFDQFLQIEDSGWKGRNGTSIVKQPWKLDYYEYLKRHFADLGLCQINLLTLNDEAIAAQFGIAIHDKLYLLKIGFHEKFSEYSPGFLLLYKLIEYYCRLNSVHTISFVTGVDWIDRWRPDSVKIGIFYSSNGSLFSGFAIKVIGKMLKIRDTIRMRINK
jgi:CelD/BcsL family acetyltransferase involved in cellulose biosynthesis